ncbi:MAG: hypothetical protein QOG01_4079 [Pseudonocardiales bacterium]|jgi:hypothetical protein|nr:hypothetical protein [Pseudonocardiales bacterium]
MTAYISAPDLDFYLEVFDASAKEVQLRVAELVREQAAIGVGPGRGTFINFAALAAARVTSDSPALWIAYLSGGHPRACVKITLKDLEPLR